MRYILYSLMSWALVVHTVVNGELQDAVLDIYDTQQMCSQVRDNQGINGECYEVEAVIHPGDI
ncbi:DUF1482 family protein [Enterobacter hormaechei]|uniref:DUF1482 family protein n=1 Tax=Enterobacter hormaechei TaxID=158836 RepID=UPI002A748D01|nr:DUF1482 family protein [Enterobacter hormaechei]MDY3570234.1 DUF1482 family protein [Enterobacter hormaechei]